MGDMLGPFSPRGYRDLSCCHILDHHRNKEWTDPGLVPALIGDGLILKGGDPPKGGANVNPDPLQMKLGQIKAASLIASRAATRLNWVKRSNRRASLALK